MTAMIKFEFKGREYPINIKYRDAIEELPDKFNIHLCEIFTDEEKGLETMQRLVLDDKLCLSLMFYYLEDSGLEWSDFLDKVTESDLRKFREDFWTAVAVFSGPLKKGIVEQMWAQFKKDLKNANLEQMISEQSHSSSNQEESE